ncbi:MAG: cysteine desulfurase [Rhodothermales bacterium]
MPTLTAPDLKAVRADFTALHQEVYGHPLVYLDNAASGLKPKVVADRMQRYYALEHSNVHRGVHYLSQQATDAYEGARRTVQTFINAASVQEVIYTKGTTEAINLVASSYGRDNVKAGDEVIISYLEHHANIVPWQMLCEATGATLRVIPITDRGELDYDAFQRLLNDRTKIVAINHISNTLGTINPIERIIADAHSMGVPVLLDGAQAMPHLKVDVQALDVDFYCFSGHKMFGPTGIGVLYGKEALLDVMPPYQGGGDMIDVVTFEKTTFNELPHKFEAGTPHIAGAIGLGTAADYMTQVGHEAIAAQEHYLLRYGTERLQSIDGLRIIGTARDKASVLSFVLDGIHPYDAGTILDRLGIAVRTGHHCTQPIMQRFGIPGTIRASLAFYNTASDIDALVDGLGRVKTMLS